MKLSVDPHLLLDLRAFVTRFPWPLAEMPSPEELKKLLALDAQAPLATSDAVREAVRAMLRQAGFKPTGRSKPASEYLLKIAETGMNSINLAVDACNAVSLHSGLPISVIDLDRAVAPLSVKAAPGGASYVFNASGQTIDLAGLLCLFDAEGPAANAVKDSQRTKTRDDTRQTLSLVWGTTALAGRAEQTAAWYRELLARCGAETEEALVQMPRLSIVLYELISSGGWRAVYRDQRCPASLAAEGGAMLAALAADFARLPDIETRVLVDRQICRGDFAGCEVVEVDPAQERQTLARAAARADGTLVVAPEFDGLLAERVGWVEEAGGRLLGPSLPAVLLAGDKEATSRHLASAGVPSPQGMLIPAGRPLPNPLPWPLAVLKPRYGAGSQETHLLDRSAPSPLASCTWTGDMRLERYCPGLAASAACLCGPAGVFPLPPGQQLLSDDGRFQYLGGSLPLESPLAARASRLALAALSSIEGLAGYVGVDLILGADPRGAEDFLIEINPRLTTSYVGLRSLATTNLAQAMLDVVFGRAPLLAFHSGKVEFTSNGEVQSA